MRKAILDALKAKFQGVSESVLNRIADKLCKTVTTAEQVQTAVDGVTIQQVIEGYADSRATEASQTAVHTYEQKYGLKDGAKIEQPSGGGRLRSGRRTRSNTTRRGYRPRAASNASIASREQQKVV